MQQETVAKDRLCLDSSVFLQQNYTADPNYFTRVIKPDLYTVHWKLMGEEIEIAIEAKTRSWVGIGWKPRSLTSSCRSFPGLSLRLEADAYYKRYLEEQRRKVVTEVSLQLV